jgi:hypothetical protein
VSITQKCVATFKPGKALKEYVEGTGPKPAFADPGAAVTTLPNQPDGQPGLSV